jgi:3-oxoacyl-[acyl-carrier protein] reductase
MRHPDDEDGGIMKTILITGASGAIGRATARRLAAAGYSLYLHYYSHRNHADQLAQELAVNYPQQLFMPTGADLAAADGPENLLEQLKMPVAGIVYNCGQSDVGLFQDVSGTAIRRSLQLQLTSPFQLIQRLIVPMIRKKEGKIVVVTSIWGLTGASTEVLYSMVKGGQNTFVKALAKEMAPSGINVNAVAPGAVATPMMTDNFAAADIEAVKKEIPAGRLAKPDEIASAIAFLMNDASDYINGQILSVNGAWYC